MPHPVPIPSGPLAVNDVDVAAVEQLVGLVTQIIKSGTSGATLNTPNTQVPFPAVNPTGLVSLELDTADEQIWLRQLATALRYWITTGGAPPPPTNPVESFSGTCLAGDLVGDLVRETGSLSFTRADPTTIGTLPVVGVITSKPTSTTCVVQTSGAVTGIYVGLTPGRVYWVGNDGRPSAGVPTGAQDVHLFAQAVGFAINATSILFRPSTLISGFYAEAIVIASDTFTRANNPSNPGSTEVGALAWQKFNETGGVQVWGIINNSLYTTGGEFNTTSYVDAGVANVEVSITQSVLSGSQSWGVAVRGSAWGQFYVFLVENTELSLIDLNTNLGWIDLVGSTFPRTATAGDTYKMRVVGNSIKCYANGALIFNITDATYPTNTKVGVFAYVGQEGNRWDNFLVTVAT